MIVPKLVIIAETVIVDRTTNQISAINCFEQFYPSGYPLLIPRLSIIAVLERELDDPLIAQLRISILLDNNEFYNQELSSHFSEGSQLNRTLLQFDGFVITRPGVVQFRCSVGDQSATSIRIPAFPVGTQRPHILDQPVPLPPRVIDQPVPPPEERNEARAQQPEAPQEEN
jgi:hypothetical protein